MWILLTAVVTASLLGSMHCIGMCGPLAIWASGAGDNNPRHKVVIATGMYHVGRMVTYALAGFVAGAIGGIVDLGGETLGLQLAAARIVGLIMVILGLNKLWQLIGHTHGKVNELRPSRISKWLVKLRPYIFRLPLSGRALATGLLTTLLPCGWLYLFALVAAGTGSMVLGPIVMVAFWIGTVPALTGLIAGTVALSRKFTTAVPTGAAIVLILAGCYTASGRGFASLHSLADIRPKSKLVQTTDDAGSVSMNIAHEIDELVKTPLPCCAEEAAGDGQP